MSVFCNAFILSSERVYIRLSVISGIRTVDGKRENRKLKMIAASMNTVIAMTAIFDACLRPRRLVKAVSIGSSLLSVIFAFFKRDKCHYGEHGNKANEI